MNLIATSTFGLEAVVSRELEALGYSPEIVSVGRIAFEGDQSAIFRANTWLRCADRVLIEMGSFEATDFGELFDRAVERRRPTVSMSPQLDQDQLEISAEPRENGIPLAAVAEASGNQH